LLVYSYAPSRIEGEKVLQREIRLRVWFTSHDDPVPLLPCGGNITTHSERNATFPLLIATYCHMHPFANHFCNKITTLRVGGRLMGRAALDAQSVSG
jgi:hypothetical protein